MNILCVLCLWLFTFDVKATDSISSGFTDFFRGKVGRLLKSASKTAATKVKKVVRNTLGGNSNDSNNSRTRSRSWNGRSSGSGAENIDARLISRRKLFGHDSIVTARISPDGKTIAYIAKHDDTNSVHISNIDRRRSPESIIKENAHIDDIEFIGNNNLVYSFKDENKCMRLKRIKLNNKDRDQIRLDVDAENIRIIKAGYSPEFIAVAHVGKRFVSYKINVQTLSVKKMDDNDVPPIALYGNNLEELLKYDDVSGYEANVYINKKLLNEGSGFLKIDSIKDTRTQRYISVNSTHSFKLVEKNGRVTLISKNLKSGQEESIVISGSSDLRIEDCRVSLDSNGKPLFYTISEGHSINRHLYRSSKEHVNRINDTFQNSDWCRIDASADGDTWLLCVTHPQRPDRYFVYYTETHRLKEVATSNKEIDGNLLQKTEYREVSTGNNSYVRVFLTKCDNHNAGRPMFVMLGSELTKKSKWNFNPHAQLFANRGCSVLLIDCQTPRSRDFNDVVQSAKDDIINAVNWCIKNKICVSGNICLYAKDRHCIPALLAFKENQGIISSCILLPGDDLRNDSILSEVDIEDISNPIMIINEEDNFRNHGEDYDIIHSSAAKDAPISYFTTEDQCSRVGRAGLMELFVSAHHDIRTEPEGHSDIGDFRKVIDANGILENLNRDTHSSNSRSYSNGNRRNHHRGANYTVHDLITP
ncbi:hypothetical protein FACS189449_00110 [Alphaproteobacteria bacterium]|nr:hypothetical protein FACS189449_00110 [Alphaproteobacteria bacterium]